jgi:hypothetical protein
MLGVADHVLEAQANRRVVVDHQAIEGQRLAGQGRFGRDGARHLSDPVRIRRLLPNGRF